MTDDQVRRRLGPTPREGVAVDERHTRFDVPTQLAISLIENPRMGESVNDLTGRGGGAQPKARVVKIFRCPTAAFHM